MHAPRRSADILLACCFAALSVFTLIIVLAGAASDIARISPSIPDSDPHLAAFSFSALLTTILVAAIIAALATLFALPVAWSLRQASPTWLALAFAPVLLPAYFAFAGWSAFRGPGTALGDWIASGSPRRSVLAAFLLAILGLALWAWPIALVALVPPIRRLPRDLLDGLRLDAPSIPRLLFERARLIGPAILAASALVWLVMLGSAVPLHLAQVPTLAVHVWTYLSLTPDPGRAWIAASPLILLAALGSFWIARRVTRDRRPSAHDDLAPPNAPPSRVPWPLIAAWTLSIAAPLTTQLLVAGDRAQFAQFWRTTSSAWIESLQTAAWVAALAAFITLATARLAAISGPPRALARAVLISSLFLALIPGLMIGHAVLASVTRTWTPRWFDDSTAPVIGAHLARFAFVPAIAGWWIVAIESPDQRALRALDGPGLLGWLRLVLLRSWGIVAAAALIAAALSLHEIEAAVLLTPPGLGSVSQRTLELLHYAKDRQLAAAMVSMGAIGLLLAGAAAVLIVCSTLSPGPPPHPPIRPSISPARD